MYTVEINFSPYFKCSNPNPFFLFTQFTRFDIKFFFSNLILILRREYKPYREVFISACSVVICSLRFSNWILVLLIFSFTILDFSEKSLFETLSDSKKSLYLFNFYSDAS